jgi:hypothetical protein
MIIKRAQFKNPISKGRECLIKFILYESTNRERIRFYQPGYQILLSSLLLIGTEVVALVKEH